MQRRPDHPLIHITVGGGDALPLFAPETLGMYRHGTWQARIYAPLIDLLVFPHSVELKVARIGNRSCDAADLAFSFAQLGSCVKLIELDVSGCDVAPGHWQASKPRSGVGEALGQELAQFLQRSSTSGPDGLHTLELLDLGSNEHVDAATLRHLKSSLPPSVKRLGLAGVTLLQIGEDGISELVIASFIKCCAQGPKFRMLLLRAPG